MSQATNPVDAYWHAVAMMRAGLDVDAIVLEQLNDERFVFEQRETRKSQVRFGNIIAHVETLVSIETVVSWQSHRVSKVNVDD